MNWQQLHPIICFCQIGQENLEEMGSKGHAWPLLIQSILFELALLDLENVQRSLALNEKNQPETEIFKKGSVLRALTFRDDQLRQSPNSESACSALRHSHRPGRAGQGRAVPCLTCRRQACRAWTWAASPSSPDEKRHRKRLLSQGLSSRRGLSHHYGRWLG